MRSIRGARQVLGILVVVAGLLAVGGCFNPLDRAADRDPNPNHVIVGSGSVLEAQIIGQIYIDALRANGFQVGDALNSGTRERYVPALKSGDIDLLPDYLGNLTVYLAENNGTVDAEQAQRISALTSQADLEAALPQVLGPDLQTLTPAPGSNSDSVTVTADTARKWRLRSIADLAAVSHTTDVTFMANSEFATRPVGVPGLKKHYGLDVSFVPNNDSGGQATINALTSGQVTAADIYTTTPAIATEHLVVLDDPAHNFPANNIVPLVAKSKASPKLAKVIDAVSAKLTVDALRHLNAQVSGAQKVEVEDAAADWVHDNGLDRPLP